MDYFFPQTIYHNDQEIEVMIEVTSITAGDPGRYDGPPEYCYPAEEPEVEYNVWVGKYLAHDLRELVDEDELISDYLQRTEEYKYDC